MTMITEQAIISAAQALVEEGTNPTQVTVRERLGGGSFATIGPVLKRWKQQQVEAQVVPEVELPVSVSDSLHDLGAALWTQAVTAAESRMEHEREQIASEREQMADELKEASDYITSLERELESVKGQLEQAHLDSISLRETHADTLTALSASRAENAQLSARVSDLREALGIVKPEPSKLPADASGMSRSSMDVSFLELRPKWMDGLGERAAQALYKEYGDCGFDQLMALHREGADFSKVPNVGRKTAQEIAAWIEAKAND